MTKRYVVRTVLTLAVLVGGLGVAQADILPVARPDALLGTFPYTIKSPSPVTLVILRDGTDITSSWLPEPGDSVQIGVKINGAIQASPPPLSVVPPASSPTYNGTDNPFLKAGVLTSSAYRGECTNKDHPTRALNDPDFELMGTNTLTSFDCGGFAVIDVDVPAGPGVPGGVYKFFVPQDDDANGIPTTWQNTFCSTVPCPTGREDNDPAPVSGTFAGDQLSALDEYRGFRIRGRHVRFDPRQKDVVLGRANPQCIGTNDPFAPEFRALSRVGGGTVTYPTHGTAPNTTLTPLPVSGTTITLTAGSAAFVSTDIGREIVDISGPSPGARATITGFTSTTQVTADVTRGSFASPISAGRWHITSLFDHAANLFGAAQVHLLYNPDSPNLHSSEWIDNFVRYSDAGGVVLTSGGGTTDRQINKNAVLSGGVIAKGWRFIECTDFDTATPVPATPLGKAGRGVGPGYAVIFSNRTEQEVQRLIDLGAGAPLRFSTYVGGSWTSPTLVPDGDPTATTGDGDPTNATVVDFLRSALYRFAAPHEAVGHAGVLTKNETVIKKTSYGYHYPPETGDILDQLVRAKVQGGFNTFYVPSIYNSTDRADFQAE